MPDDIAAATGWEEKLGIGNHKFAKMQTEIYSVLSPLGSDSPFGWVGNTPAGVVYKCSLRLLHQEGGLLIAAPLVAATHYFTA